MKLRHCRGSSFSSQSLVNFARRRRTLSATAKKPALLAGFLYLRFRLTGLTTLLLLSTLLSPTSRSAQLFIQTPSAPNPA